MMEAAKIEFLVDHLARSATDFEACISGANAAQWSLRPSPDRWTIADTAEHVINVDAGISRMLATLPKWPEEEYNLERSLRKDDLVMRIAVQRETKMEAPVTVRPSGNLRNADEFYPRFRETQNSLHRAVTANPQLLRGRFREHPSLKKLDGYQWLLVCSCHRRRHMDQIEEVKRALIGEQLLNHGK